MRNHSTTKRRNLISPNLQAIELRDVTDTAKVTVMLRPSERQSIFDRIVFKGSTPEREAKNHHVSRTDIIHTLRIETRARLAAERQTGFMEGKRCNLIPPSGPAQARRAA